MVSIQLPGMVKERKLEIPQWLPDLPDAEVLKITEVRTIELMRDELANKIEKLKESNLQLREFIKSEKDLWEAGGRRGEADGVLPTNTIDADGEHGTDSASTMSGLPSVVPSKVCSSADSECGNNPTSSDSLAKSVGTVEEGPASNQILSSSLNASGTVPSSSVGGVGSNDSATNPNDPNADISSRVAAFLDSSSESAVTDGRDAGQASATSEEYYEFVSAIFENTHIMAQMQVRLDLLNNRVQRLSMSQGMTL